MALAPKLKDAGETATHRVMSKRKRGPMEDQIKLLKRQITRREAKGILKTIIMLKPSADPEIVAYSFETISMCLRCGVATRWPKFVMCLFRVWDEMWACMYNSGKGINVTVHKFFTEHSAAIKATHGSEYIHYQTMLDATGTDFLPYAAALKAANDTKLGKACWGWALPKTALAVISKAIKDAKAAKPVDVTLGETYDVDWIDQVQDAAMATIKDFGADKASEMF